jgi:nucleoside-diphosphate-sugar epimerase
MLSNGVGVLGSTSLVGKCLLPLLKETGSPVVAFSRQKIERADDGAEWRQFPIVELSASLDPVPQGNGDLPLWVCVAPIWVLPLYFSMLEHYGARRVVVLSSTSRFTKTDSLDPAENAIASRLAEGEELLRAWAANKDIEWVILRPTLIYGRGLDKNITEIARIVGRFGFFPLLGKAMGLRQPIYAEDVAAACVAALRAPVAANRAYNISGGEILPYREMVCRVFAAMQRQPRLVTIPLVVFRVAVKCLRAFPRYRDWSPAMVDRMNRDLIFDHADAARDLGFSPRSFQLAPEDVAATNWLKRP